MNKGNITRMGRPKTGTKKKHGKNKTVQVLTPISTGLSESQTRNLIFLGQSAAKAYQAGDFQTAEQMCQRSLSMFPDFALAWAILATIKFKTGEFQAAADLMEKSLSILPGVADRWMSYGVILKNLHRYEEALKAVEKSLKIEPKSSKALNNKATTLEVLGRTKESKRVFSQLIQATQIMEGLSLTSQTCINLLMVIAIANYLKNWMRMLKNYPVLVIDGMPILHLGNILKIFQITKKPLTVIAEQTNFRMLAHNIL